jgi:regulatory protein YycI of two-component signal transduction system YycFG
MQDSDIKVELGYYTLIQQTESQVLVPTWHLIVEHDKKKEDLYVNAIEGRVIPKDDKENESLE